MHPHASSSPEREIRALPELRLERAALEHNVRLMAEWCREHRVELAPHIKTTMVRPIVEQQLEAGAWGVTVATARQADVARGWGVRRILVANEVIHSTDLALLRRLLDETPDLELFCLIDSPTGVDLAAAALHNTHNPLRVLVDVGVPGGRTGVRNAAEAYELAAAAVKASPGLLLVGVAGYEGCDPIPGTPRRSPPSTRTAV
ncbi:alanine racemase [Streptomyces lydicus]|nr:alanine racemase [Streptomyces lydicus]